MFDACSTGKAAVCIDLKNLLSGDRREREMERSSVKSEGLEDMPITVHLGVLSCSRALTSVLYDVQWTRIMINRSRASQLNDLHPAGGSEFLTQSYPETSPQRILCLSWYISEQMDNRVLTPQVL